jgi:glucan-binding YG repeat protein
MAKQNKAQKDTVERVMHEFKHGELKMRGGRRVKNPRQAIAIGLREAGASKYESKEDNERNLRRTKQKERRGETARAEAEGKRNDPTAEGGGKTRAELYEEAKRRNVPGRSKMSRAELQRALHH